MSAFATIISTERDTGAQGHEGFATLETVETACAAFITLLILKHMDERECIYYPEIATPPTIPLYSE